MYKQQIALALTAIVMVACSPTASEQAARNESPQAVGVPPDNGLTQGNMVETSSPEIANTAEASRLQTRADAAGTPQARAKGDVMGEGAPDTSGRADQEQPKDQ